MLLACSNMTAPVSSLIIGACQPPCVKPPAGSSSGAPGPCATPSKVMNSVTISLPTCVPFRPAPGETPHRAVHGSLQFHRVQIHSVSLDPTHLDRSGRHGFQAARSGRAARPDQCVVVPPDG